VQKLSDYSLPVFPVSPLFFESSMSHLNFFFLPFVICFDDFLKCFPSLSSDLRRFFDFFVALHPLSY